MADQEQLKILKKGVRAWNSWRCDNPSVKTDLSGADLSGANLVRANFSGTNLFGANLSASDLSEANLSRAVLNFADFSMASLLCTNFCWAVLSWADLFGANLSGADLADADLSGAKLSYAQLHMTNFFETNLCRADLSGAEFSGANLRDTILNDIDLTETIGLADCSHEGPSCVDSRTLAQSKHVPIEFWRGCGLSNWQVEAAKLSKPDLTQEDIKSISNEVARLRGEQPIQHFSLFISYSSKDDTFARRLYSDLQESGVRCWFASEDMKIGDRIRRRIDEVIHMRDKLLLILSEHSVGSEWVEKEVETAFERERESNSTVLFPIKLDSFVDNVRIGWAADIQRSRHIGDFTNWADDEAYQRSFDRVLRDLRALQ